MRENFSTMQIACRDAEERVRKKAYRASSRAALGLQNLPLLSILGITSLELEFSTASLVVKAQVRRRELLGQDKWRRGYLRTQVSKKEEEDEILRELEMKLRWVFEYVYVK